MRVIFIFMDSAKLTHKTNKSNPINSPATIIKLVQSRTSQNTRTRYAPNTRCLTCVLNHDYPQAH